MLSRSLFIFCLSGTLTLLTACSSEDQASHEEAAQENTVETRTTPVGQVDVGTKENKTEEPTATEEKHQPTETESSAENTQSSHDLAKGKEVYDQSCFACHTSGVAGAPKLADSAEWEKRLNKGKDLLYQHAIKGFMGVGMMPPKGGNSKLTDDEVKAAVDYMISAK